MGATGTKKRTRPRTTCDQCGRDYADEPERCVTVQLDRPYLVPQWETICLECVADLPITGCRRLRWAGTVRFIEFVLGTADPPPGWPHPRPADEEILRVLGSPGYLLPKIETPKRIDVAGELLAVIEAAETS